jgi:hypothetical protein
VPNLCTSVNAELARSLTATPCQNALDFSCGLPFIFGVPASEGDSTTGTQITTLVAGLDFSTVPDTARLLLPVHRCTLLTVLHLSISDTLLHKYDQGLDLGRVEMLSARVLTPSHKPEGGEHSAPFACRVLTRDSGDAFGSSATTGGLHFYSCILSSVSLFFWVSAKMFRPVGTFDPEIRKNMGCRRQNISTPR